MFFASGSATMNDAGRATLERTARWLSANREKSVMVEGHASSTGSASANMSLSEARTQAAKDYLVEQGVDASRITTEAHGMERPEYRPSTNGKNRRVVIKVSE